MTRFPVWRTEPAPARDIPLGGYVAATLITVALPAGLGFVLLKAVGLLGLSSAGLASLAYVMTVSPILSWLGVVPGAALTALMLRRGMGGLGAVLVLAAVLGFAVTIVVYGFGMMDTPILSLVALPFAGIFWGTLYLLFRDRIVAG